jgi:hypothetical protein
LSKEAQNVKISGRAWEMLRWAKFELNEKSYSDVLVTLDRNINNRTKSLEKSLKSFDETRHRIKAKTPDQKTASSPYLEKPKTVLLSPDARKILHRLKLESNKPEYTFSDAIEFLVRQNNAVWSNLPNRYK